MNFTTHKISTYFTLYGGPSGTTFVFGEVDTRRRCRVETGDGGVKDFMVRCVRF